MRSIFNILIIALLLSITGKPAMAQPDWKRKYDDPRTLRKMFNEPPMFYAPHAFWFWDDTLRNDNVQVQMVKEMAGQRLNPGYAHPRSSMDRTNPKYPSLPYDQYLEKVWFDTFGNAVKKAKETGLTLGYCDDYDWPSGQAAGRVLKTHPELEAKYLDWKRYEVKGKSPVSYNSIDFAVAAKLSGGKIDASSLIIIGEGDNIKWTAPEGDWVIYAYTKKYHPGIDGGKVNYLDPRVMETFIPIVHEQYAKKFGDEMGKTIPGVFVDNEGDYGWQMAWSEYLAETYKSSKKRDIRLWLPLLTEKDKDGLYAKARCDWFETITDVYDKSYFKPINNWLDKKGMYYISNLWEESLQLQAGAVGDFMKITRTASMPGTDCLVMKSQDVHDFKETQTVAELEDRPFMSEIMGVAGWEQTPAMMKMTINAITSYGVNHVVPHGIYLNRKTETYPFPTDWYTENPYWPYLHYWTDFSRRASFVNRQSKLVADVLLINPMESIWADAEGLFAQNKEIAKGEDPANWSKASLNIEAVYSEAMREMNKNNIDFLITDKYYLNKSMIGLDGKSAKLSINDHDFSALVLPPATVISHDASSKILEFARRGGTVILLGGLPEGSPEIGANDPVIIQQMKALKQLSNVVDLSAAPDRMAKMVTALNTKISPQIKLENSGRLYTAHRRSANTHFYWFANNTDTVRKFSAWLRSGKGTAEIWNCETGAVSNLKSATDNGYQKVDLTLQPYEGYWLVFNPDIKAPANIANKKPAVTEKIIDNKWQISYPGTDTIYRTSAKALFSDSPTLQEEVVKPGYNDSAWARSSFINRSLQKTTKVNGRNEKQPFKNLSGNYAYWRVVIPKGAKAVIFPKETAKTGIWVDGKKVTPDGEQVSLSNNAALLAFAIGNDQQLPLLPLKFVTGAPVSVPLNSWFHYGLDQYTGYVDYQTTIKAVKKDQKVIIDLGGVKYMAEVFINELSVGARLWPPYNFDISGALKNGDNKIRIRVGNLMVNQMSMQNDMHKLRTWSWGFSPDPDIDQYNAGMSGPVKLLITP
jgi:hypothetical protein